MGLFYVVQGDYLVSHGYAQDGCEQMQAGKGQSVVLGAVPGFGETAMPLAGGKWHVVEQNWVGARTKEDSGGI